MNDLRIKTHRTCDSLWCASRGHVVPASVSDLVAALQEEGVGEVVETDHPGEYLDGSSRYLVVRIDGETP